MITTDINSSPESFRQSELSSGHSDGPAESQVKYLNSFLSHLELVATAGSSKEAITNELKAFRLIAEENRSLLIRPSKRIELSNDQYQFTNSGALTSMPAKTWTALMLFNNQSSNPNFIGNMSILTALEAGNYQPDKLIMPTNAITRLSVDRGSNDNLDRFSAEAELTAGERPIHGALKVLLTVLDEFREARNAGISFVHKRPTEMMRGPISRGGYHPLLNFDALHHKANLGEFYDRDIGTKELFRGLYSKHGLFFHGYKLSLDRFGQLHMS